MPGPVTDGTALPLQHQVVNEKRWFAKTEAGCIAKLDFPLPIAIAIFRPFRFDENRGISNAFFKEPGCAL